MYAYLFEKNAIINQDIRRNIVSLRESEDLFDDLTGGDPEDSRIAMEAEMRVKQNLQPFSPGIIQRSFHYSTAIAFPFEQEPFLSTRYGDGTFGVWYGSLELETTINETAYHTIWAELAVEGVDEEIIRERAVYDVHLKSILIDLREIARKEPQLVQNDYDFTQQIGRQLHKQGHPGLLTPSARCKGSNAVVFNREVLTNPRVRCYLTYYFNPRDMKVRVEREAGTQLMLVDGAQWF